jgi:hypothetical protein
MPLEENGAGSAWGLPVIKDGKKRYSALAASERLTADSGRGGEFRGISK